MEFIADDTRLLPIFYRSLPKIPGGRIWPADQCFALHKISAQMTFWHNIKKMLGITEPAPIVETKHAERRGAVRWPQRFVQGLIWSDRMAFSKACSIRDISVTGAQIELYDDTLRSRTVEGPFVLFLPSEKLEVDCELQWWRGRSMGLRFIGAYRAPTRNYGE